MVYSEVIKNNYHLILNKNKKYTKKHIDIVLSKVNNITRNQARFIVLCTAIFYNAIAAKILYKPIRG